MGADPHRRVAVRRSGGPAGFLSSPEMRDPALLQDYFEQVATDRVTAFDATEFLALARHLDSPMIAALRSVVAGEPPPIVTSTR